MPDGRLLAASAEGSRVSADLIERIARETTDLNNRRAWVAIFDRLVAAGVARRDATAQRHAVWQARKRARLRRRQQPSTRQECDDASDRSTATGPRA
jgi:hypothetical protein